MFHQAAYAFAAAEGKPVHFRDLAKKHVKLDESTRCKPDDDKKETYARILAKQSDLTKRLHAAGYL